LGLAAGIAPGPLLSLVVSETTRGNKLNGILIALAPLLTDLPIVFVSIFLLSTVASADVALGVLSIIGGLFVAYMGIKNLQHQSPATAEKAPYSQSLKYGVITNFLSPHPYVFWITIGAPTFIKASKVNYQNGIVFIIAFYFLLIGSKILIAFVTSLFNSFFSGNIISWIMKIMGVLLLILAGVMVYEGIGLISGMNNSIN